MQTPSRSLRIAVISKADAGGGGASKVAEQSVAWLKAAGHQATHFAGFTTRPSRHAQKLYWPVTKAGIYGHRLLKYAGIPELVPLELPKLWPAIVGKYDLVHFHDLAGTISPVTLRALAAKLPVVWTIHDCSPFTGGCLYPMGCTKFQSSCAGCPSKEWPIDNAFVFTRLLQNVKAGVHANPNITCVTPSQWMADTAASASIVQRKPLVIANGIDLTEYRGLEKNLVRRVLGLPEDRPLVLLSAGNLKDPRKGVREAIQALHGLSGPKPLVLLLGHPDAETDKLLSGLAAHSFGYVSDSRLLNQIYAAADVFLFPSFADNQPLAILESLASGTPVVGFATGGVPEMIRNGVTGQMVPTGDVPALSAALAGFLADKVTPWRDNCLDAAPYYDKTMFVARHEDLYARLIKDFA